MECSRPDYTGGWTGAIVPAVLGQAAPDWLPEPARRAEAVVLLVLDGLGWHAVREHGDRLPTLSAMAGAAVTSVVPTTTASALTSITTGLTPGEHGVVGYRMRVGGDVLNVLKWSGADGQSPDPVAVQPTPPFLGQNVPIVTRAEFVDTGFTKAHLRGTRFRGWRTLATIVTHCRLLVAAGERFVYAYYDGIDKVAHAHGLLEPYYADELAAGDRLVSELLSVLPSNCALVVTADHGQVHIGSSGWLGLEPLAPLVSAYAGDGRFRSLHARPGASTRLLDAARLAVGDRAWVLSRAELTEGGWLGPCVSPSIAGRLGDVVLVAKGHYAFADPGQPHERGLVAGHGSVSPEELQVPLLAARGRR